MGDRVAVRFVDGQDISVAFFAHWGGTRFPQKVVPEFFENVGPKPESDVYPWHRREPSLTMLNFIGYVFGTQLDYPVQSSYYLGKDYKDGDCGDNGCWDFDSKTGKLVRIIFHTYDGKELTWRVAEGKDEVERYLRRNEGEGDFDYEEYKAMMRSFPKYKEEGR